ncbi:MAG: hypothetical protein WBD31_28945, partial [Rubripirellula sp.]
MKNAATKLFGFASTAHWARPLNYISSAEADRMKEHNHCDAACRLGRRALAWLAMGSSLVGMTGCAQLQSVSSPPSNWQTQATSGVATNHAPINSFTPSATPPQAVAGTMEQAGFTQTASPGVSGVYSARQFPQDQAVAPVQYGAPINNGTPQYNAAPQY